MVTYDPTSPTTPISKNPYYQPPEKKVIEETKPPEPPKKPKVPPSSSLTSTSSGSKSSTIAKKAQAPQEIMQEVTPEEVKAETQKIKQEATKEFARKSAEEQAKQLGIPLAKYLRSGYSVNFDIPETEVKDYLTEKRRIEQENIRRQNAQLISVVNAIDVETSKSVFLESIGLNDTKTLNKAVAKAKEFTFFGDLGEDFNVTKIQPKTTSERIGQFVPFASGIFTGRVTSEVRNLEESGKLEIGRTAKALYESQPTRYVPSARNKAYFGSLSAVESELSRRENVGKMRGVVEAGIGLAGGYVFAKIPVKYTEGIVAKAIGSAVGTAYIVGKGNEFKDIIRSDESIYSKVEKSSKFARQTAQEVLPVLTFAGGYQFAKSGGFARLSYEGYQRKLIGEASIGSTQEIRETSGFYRQLDAYRTKNVRIFSQKVKVNDVEFVKRPIAVTEDRLIFKERILADFDRFSDIYSDFYPKQRTTDIMKLAKSKKGSLQLLQSPKVVQKVEDISIYEFKTPKLRKLYESKIGLTPLSSLRLKQSLQEERIRASKPISLQASIQESRFPILSPILELISVQKIKTEQVNIAALDLKRIQDLDIRPIVRTTFEQRTIDIIPVPERPFPEIGFPIFGLPKSLNLGMPNNYQTKAAKRFGLNTEYLSDIATKLFPSARRRAVTKRAKIITGLEFRR